MTATITGDRGGTKFQLPALVLSDGAIEGIKWLALVLMTLDHINKHLLHGSIPAIFAVGRTAMPLFALTLAYNLARPGALQGGVYFRVAKRLALIGAISSVPFIALGGLAWGWWPLNVMAMFLASTCVMYFWEKGGAWGSIGAIAAFSIGGGLVEFWWPGIALCVSAWRYFKRPRLAPLCVCIASTASLYVINRNHWALAAFAVLLLATKIKPEIPRTPKVFYAYYPAHLAVIWLLTKLT